MDDKQYRVVLVKPMMKPQDLTIDGSLENMQRLVGGLIEVVYPFPDDPSAVLVCNDEGKLMRLLPNRFLKDDKGEPYDVVCGNFFVIGSGEDGDFASLTDKQAEKYMSEYGGEMLVTAPERSAENKDKKQTER